jgi:hypothetical protein
VSISFTQLLKNLGTEGLDLPDGPMLCSRLSEGITPLFIIAHWSIAYLKGNETRRRCDARWVKDGTGVLWGGGGYSARIGRWGSLLEQQVEIPRYRISQGRYVTIPLRGVHAEGFKVSDSAVVIGPLTCLLPGSDWLSVLRNSDFREEIDDHSLATDDSLAHHPAIEALSFMLSLNHLPIDLLDHSVIPIMSQTEVAQLLD